MPIYEYRCEHCGHELEVIQKLADDPLKDCPDCTEPALKKLISAVGFRLKGSGWYETDFKTSDNKRNLSSGDDKPKETKSEGGDKKTAGKSEGTGSSKSETSSKSTKPSDKNSGGSNKAA